MISMRLRAKGASIRTAHARALLFGRIPINMFGLVTPSLLEKGISESPSLLPCLTYRTGGIIVSIIIVWLVVASLSGKHIS